jgi:Mn2+/Fe2+ NRAMP family transporter
MQWRRGLSLKVSEAPLFYGALALAALLGSAVALCGISPFRLLFIAGIIGALGTPIGLSLLLRVAFNRKLMRGRPASRPLLIGGWIVCALIAASSAGFLIPMLVRAF